MLYYIEKYKFNNTPASSEQVGAWNKATFPHLSTWLKVRLQSKVYCLIHNLFPTVIAFISDYYGSILVRFRYGDRTGFVIPKLISIDIVMTVHINDFDYLKINAYWYSTFIQAKWTSHNNFFYKINHNFEWNCLYLEYYLMEYHLYYTIYFSNSCSF